MQAETIDHLIKINAQFYQEYASPFAATRRRLQPGVQRILATISPDARILDLGCGNGELWRCLSEKDFRGIYIGLDFSPQLLEIASRHSAQEDHPKAPLPSFQLADLCSDSWAEGFLIEGSSFTGVLAFAVLHHIPSIALRRKILQKVRLLLEAGGRFIHSEWQFLNSKRLQERIQPWSAAGLHEGDVEEGDYLLDWRREGHGLRYVHHFTPLELETLAQECGFTIREQFSSDGEGGRLGLYQTWEPA